MPSNKILHKLKTFSWTNLTPLPLWCGGKVRGGASDFLRWKEGGRGIFKAQWRGGAKDFWSQKRLSRNKIFPVQLPGPLLLCNIASNQCYSFDCISFIEHPQSKYWYINFPGNISQILKTKFKLEIFILETRIYWIMLKRNSEKSHSICVIYLKFECT